tara:strand:- start:7668 stop:8798 length:1131 start_codon:yes stop_codon:yes gene_type:complete
MFRGSFFAALTLSILTTAATLTLPTGARADYRFCNTTSYVLQGAIGTAGPSAKLRGTDAGEPAPAPDAAAPATPADHTGLAGGETQAGTKWLTQGWTQVLPGECASVLPGPVSKGDYYVFARSIDAHQGPTKYFAGSARFCTLPEDFSLEGRENCALRGYDSHDFIRVSVKAGADWTTTFGEPRDYSLERARIAGAQRLLRDNGLRLPKIDGYAAKNTERAVMAFQRTLGDKANGTIDRDLIDKLVDGAVKEQQKFGLNICNKTNFLVWASVGVSESDDDMSSGWIRVAQGTCAKAIKDKLTAKSYYFYAEATDDKGAIAMRGGRRLIWMGKQAFCVKTTRYEIKGREACAARGYDERPFMMVNTGSKGTYDLVLE